MSGIDPETEVLEFRGFGDMADATFTWDPTDDVGLEERRPVMSSGRFDWCRSCSTAQPSPTHDGCKVSYRTRLTRSARILAADDDTTAEERSCSCPHHHRKGARP
jgi:hypothetical protein